MHTARQTATVASGGTTADLPSIPGMVLVGLQLPVLDSTTVAGSIYRGAASGAVAAYSSGGTVFTFGGAANVGSRYVAVSEEFRLMAADADGVRLTVATQSADRAIVGIYMNGQGA